MGDLCRCMKALHMVVRFRGRLRQGSRVVAHYTKTASPEESDRNEPGEFPDMHKIVEKTVVANLSAMLLSGTITWSAPAPKRTGDKALLLRMAAAAELSDIKVRWNRLRGTPSLVTGSDLSSGAGRAAAGGARAQAVRSAAMRVMERLADVYGVKDVQREFDVGRESVGRSGYRHVRLTQQHKGFPVRGGSVVVHFDPAGKCRSVNGRYIPDLDPDLRARITTATAGRIAVKDLAAFGKPRGRVTADPVPVVLAAIRPARLAYETTAVFNEDGRMGEWRYWVDAVNGRVLLRYDNRQHIDPPSTNGQHETISGTVLAGEGGGVATVEGWHDDSGAYYLWNKTNTWYVYNAGASGVDALTYAYRNSNDWSTSDTVEMSMAVGFDATEMYFRSVHGRLSFNDANAMAVANVHVGVSFVNAYWSPSQRQFFFGDGDGSTADPLTVLDIAGHEFTHAVTEYTADLIYFGESGALNESFSDIFGALVEFYAQPDGRDTYPDITPGHSDWLMGEDSWLVGTALRDMREPGSTETLAEGYQQPSRFEGTDWQDTSDQSDNGGVHQNSGVQNFFFYLLSEGGVGDNDGLSYDVTGIGFTNAGTLAYLTLTAYLTPWSDYEDARDAWLAAAGELDDTGTTSNALVSAVEAWAACGVGMTTVNPTREFISVGEPFIAGYEPSNIVYTIYSLSGVDTTWSVTHAMPWLSVNPSEVTIPPVGTTSIVASIVENVAVTLAEGTYYDMIEFRNLTNEKGNTSRAAILRIAANYDLVSEPHAWIDPVAEGHSFVYMTEGRSAARPMPFDFRLYASNYPSMYISDKGLIGFVDEQLSPTDNAHMPSLAAPNAMLCPLWDGLKLAHDSAVYAGVEGTSPTSSLVVTWLNMSHADDPLERFSFQALIREGVGSNAVNDIVFQYLDTAQDNMVLGGGRDATIGVEDIDGLLNKNYLYTGGELVADGQSLLFTMNPVSDTNAPLGAIKVLSDTDTNVVFEVRWNEIVGGLDLGDFVVGGNVAGVAPSTLSGNAERYLVSVTGFTGHGVIELGVAAGAVVDLAGNTNAALGPALYVIPLAERMFFDDMEHGPDRWAASEGTLGIYTLSSWEWGAPTDPSGPSAAYSGSSCWGTVLDGPYTNLVNAWVESPAIHVGDNPIIEFYLWLSLEWGYDHGYVEVNGGQGWVNVTPGGSYSGSTFSWGLERIVLDNSTFGNRALQVRFRIETDETVVWEGMFVDDLKITSRWSPGVWVYAHNPTNAAAGSSPAVEFQVYNTDTATHHDVTATVESWNEGVDIPAGTVIDYGDIAPGVVVTGAPAVTIVLGDAGDFASPVAELYHLASTAQGDEFGETVPFGVTGTADGGSNRLVATTGPGVIDWLGRPLRGNGDADSSLLQVIYAGADGVADPPSPDGAATGDDVLLQGAGSAATFGRFGEGDGIPLDAGRFLKPFLHGLTTGEVVYVRAWDGSSFDGSVAYGDSALYSVSGAAGETNDFGAWTVGMPIDFVRDLNGDSVADGWNVVHGGDPVLPTGPLNPEWTAESVAGAYGSGEEQMAYPESVAAWTGFVFVADTRNDRVQVWNSELSMLVTNVGSPGTGTNELNWPGGLAVDPVAQRLVVADTKNDRIVLYDIDPASGSLTPAGGFGSSGNGPGEFGKPHGIAVDATGNVYVADTGNSRVQVFDSGGSLLWSIVSTLNQPLGVGVDATGRVYVADTDHHMISVFDSAGPAITNFGTYGSGPGQLSRPTDVFVDRKGRVYVVDQGNHRMHVFDANFAHIATYKPPAGEMGTLPGQLRFPQGACFGPGGRLYVADTWNHRVQLLSLIMDADGDGMDDFWEDSNGLDSSDPGDWDDDPDGDGLINIGEYRVGSDPRKADTNGNGINDGNEVGRGDDPTAPFDGLRITAVMPAPDVVTWHSKSGRVYSVQLATDLISSNWHDIAVVNSIIDAILTWTNEVPPTNMLYFYRIMEDTE